MSAWTLVLLPIYAAGSFYAAIVRGKTLSALHVAAFMTPLLLLSLCTVSQRASEKTSTRGAPVLLYVANAIRLVLILTSSLVTVSPGSATLQQVLLLPLFACIEFFQKGRGHYV